MSRTGATTCGHTRPRAVSSRRQGLWLWVSDKGAAREPVRPISLVDEQQAHSSTSSNYRCTNDGLELEDARRAGAVTQVPRESSHRTTSIAAMTAGSSGSSPSARSACRSSSLCADVAGRQVTPSLAGPISLLARARWVGIPTAFRCAGRRWGTGRKPCFWRRQAEDDDDADHAQQRSPQEAFPDVAVFGVRDRGCDGCAEQPKENDSFEVQRRPLSPIQVG